MYAGRLSEMHSVIWEGVFSSFGEAGGDLDAFDTEVWINKQKEKILNLHAKVQSNTSLVDAAISKDYPLPLVTALLLGVQEKISILDYGGGMGAQYLDILAKIPEALSRVTYTIVEGEATIQNVPLAIKASYPLKFYQKLDTLERGFDILHIGSTLQYIEDWKELLGQLIDRFKPHYLVFSDLLAGDISTFVSHQIFYGKKIPVRFLNFPEIFAWVTEKGYQCLFKSFFQANILGQENLPSDALPEKNRLQKSRHCVFKKHETQ